MFKTMATAGLLFAALVAAPAMAQVGVAGLLICEQSRAGLTVKAFDSPLSINIGLGEPCTRLSNVVDWAVSQPLDMEAPGGPDNAGWGVRALHGRAAQRGPVASAPPSGGRAWWTAACHADRSSDSAKEAETSAVFLPPSAK